MLPPVDDDYFDMLQQPHTSQYRAAAFYGSDQTLASVPITNDGSLDFSADAEVQCTGTLHVAKGNESLIPTSKADILAPYGQEIRVERVDSIGSREWVTPMGQLRITGLPSMTEYKIRFPTAFKTQAWFAELSVADRFDKLRADLFLQPQNPNFAGSTWDEIQRFSNVPIVRNQALPDLALPSNITYDDTSRIDTITLLFSNLGAYPSLNRLGALTGRVKDPWLTATVPVFTLNGVISMDDSLSNDVYNSVVVTNNTGARGIAEITDIGDPLCVTGPLGRRVYTQSSSLYTSQMEVDAAAVTILTRVSSRRSRTVTVACLPQPHLELGDYIRAIDTATGLQVDGEISKMSFPLNPLASMSMDLIVAETR